MKVKESGTVADLKETYDTGQKQHMILTWILLLQKTLLGQVEKLVWDLRTR